MKKNIVIVLIALFCTGCTQLVLPVGDVLPFLLIEGGPGIEAPDAEKPGTVPGNDVPVTNRVCSIDLTELPSWHGVDYTGYDL